MQRVQDPGEVSACACVRCRELDSLDGNLKGSSGDIVLWREIILESYDVRYSPFPNSLSFFPYARGVLLYNFPS